LKEIRIYLCVLWRNVREYRRDNQKRTNHKLYNESWPCIKSNNVFLDSI